MTNINFSLRPLLPFRIGFFRTILFLTLILGSTDNHAHHNSRLDVPRNGIEFAINPDDRDGGGMEEYLPVSVYVAAILGMKKDS